MDTPGTAWLIWVLVTIAVPIVVIFIVLGVLRWSRMSAQKAVRSEEYWDETPDGRRYPTGYERMYDPDARRAATRGDHPGDQEPGAGEDGDAHGDPGNAGGEGGSHPYGQDRDEPDPGDEGSPGR
ncbi:hypothetical protein IDM40_25990 [Nocardiopsis sp. HNM0947]|uniref:Secreted protein n=1 Tax=Nocardiopsis coralli TaxID=2772213 RepID=A0ABR9PE50_9ACTN|nr:hypothetical protein [Nocardiopsis coralli]MBE3002125.1 hypothetical protein [Nocardiopsis coralli]